MTNKYLLRLNFCRKATMIAVLCHCLKVLRYFRNAFVQKSAVCYMCEYVCGIKCHLLALVSSIHINNNYDIVYLAVYCFPLNSVKPFRYQK